MNRVLLLQLDGSRSLPNIALMRLAAHHRDRGDEVELRYATTAERVQPEIGDDFGAVYASTLFHKTRPLAEEVVKAWPAAIVGGTGVSDSLTLEEFGITTKRQDYSIYPDFQRSLGFARRGCRRACEFCCVPRKEGKVRPENAITEIWRGEPWPKELLLLDNDFFAPGWEPYVEDIRAGGFKVSFNQGINVRDLTPAAARAVASIEYRDDQFTRKRIYTAWDNRGDGRVLFRGLQFLVDAGVKPDAIMVYMLIGYWPGETHEDRDHRRAKLREFGARPYPMPFRRTPETVGFQRWVIGAYDKRISWADWERAGYEPRRLGDSRAMDLFAEASSE